MRNLAATTDRINTLLERMEHGDYPDRARLEETLTDGYAWALELDAECARLERRITANAERLADQSNEERVREVASLARLLTRRRHERDELRDLLLALRSGVREARAARVA
jgi:uncharacterized protein (DUF2342 family)